MAALLELKRQPVLDGQSSNFVDVFLELVRGTCCLSQMHKGQVVGIMEGLRLDIGGDNINKHMLNL